MGRNMKSDNVKTAGKVIETIEANVARTKVGCAADMIEYALNLVTAAFADGDNSDWYKKNITPYLDLPKKLRSYNTWSLAAGKVLDALAAGECISRNEMLDKVAAGRTAKHTLDTIELLRTKRSK